MARDDPWFGWADRALRAVRGRACRWCRARGGRGARAPGVVAAGWPPLAAPEASASPPCPRSLARRKSRWPVGAVGVSSRCEKAQTRNSKAVSAASRSLTVVVTASSIGAAKSGGYARYLEGKTVQPERGDYYLTPGGEPAQAPGRWLASADTRAQLRIDGSVVDGSDFIALMEGRHPRDAGARQAGADGSRGGGIDVTFSAPKSVSVDGARRPARARDDRAGAPKRRRAGDCAHDRDGAHRPPPLRRRGGGGARARAGRRGVPAHDGTRRDGRRCAGPAAAQPRGRDERGEGGREDRRGRLAPDLPLRSKVGAFYRSALAPSFSQRGYEIDAGTGKEGRYFEIAGVPQGLIDAFSARSREVAAAAERFRAKWGGHPSAASCDG